jgi:hypothetical protein
MPVSPICLVADGVGPFLPTLNGLNIGPGDVTSIQLASTAGVTNWYLQITGTDELVTTLPTLTGVGGGNLVATPSTTVTFTFPPAGTALLFQSTVDGVGGPVTTTFGLFSLTTGGHRVGAKGMILEGSTSTAALGGGWTTIVNPAIRNIGVSVGAVTSVSGSSPIASSGGTTPTISLSVPSQAQGDLLYFNGTNWVRLPAGSTGQFLKTFGAGQNPAWATVSGGGGGGFSDNATAERVRQLPALRGNNVRTLPFDDIPRLTDSPGSRAGAALATLADKAFIVNGSGIMYGMDLLTGANCAGANNSLFNLGAGPVELLGVRGQSSSGSQDYLFAALPPLPVENPWDLSFSSGTNRVWVVLNNQKGQTVLSFDATSLSLITATDVSSLLNYPSRVITDNTYAYVAAGYWGDGDRYAVIINQSTGALVGAIDVGSGFQANDMALDGAGNLYVTAYATGPGVQTSTVQKFSIAAAITAGPLSPITYSVKTPVTRAYYSVAYDTVTSSIFAGTMGATDGAEHLVQLNPSTLVEIAHLDIVPDMSTFTFQHFEFLLPAFGSLWVSSYGKYLLRINTSTFPTGTPFTAPFLSSGCVTVINLSSASNLFGLSADTTDNTILIGNENAADIFRVSSASNTQVSTISGGGGFTAETAVFTTSAIWTTFTVVVLYTPAVGTETIIQDATAAEVSLMGVSGQSPSVAVSPIYESICPAPVRACLVSSGGAPKDLTAGNSQVFAVSTTTGEIVLIDPSGGVHSAYSTGDTPGAMFVDDSGFLWVACTTSNNILKFSVNLTAYTLSLVQTISAGVTALDMISDGRFARVVANIAGTPTLYSWDLQTGNAGPVLPLTGTNFGGFTFTYPRDFYYNSAKDWLWVTDQSSTTTTVVAVKTSNQAVEQVLSVPSLPLSGQLPNTWTGARRVIGDSTNVYVTDATNSSPYVAIINQTSGLVVGLISVGSNQARDMALDGLGNIFVVNRISSVTSSTIKKYNIAAAIAAYPSTYTTTAAVTATTRGYHVCAWDPVTSNLWAGTQNNGNSPYATVETMVQLDPSTLNEIAHLDFTQSGGYFQYMIAAFGSLWFSSASSAPFTGYSGNLFRVNPSTFPAGGSVTAITTSTVSTDAISADTTNNTILVGDNYSGNIVSRVSAGSNTQVSTISPPTSGNNMAFATPTAIWITAGSLSPGLFLYTTGVGTETEISEFTQVPLPGAGARLAWDGVSIYLAVSPGLGAGNEG